MNTETIQEATAGQFDEHTLIEAQQEAAQNLVDAVDEALALTSSEEVLKIVANRL